MIGPVKHSTTRKKSGTAVARLCIPVLLTVMAAWCGGGDGGDILNVVGDVNIAVKDGGDREERLRTVAAALIPLRSGMPFTPTLLKQSYSALTAGGRYSSIVIDTSRRENIVDVSLTLTPARYLGEIHIYGEFPFFESQILEVMTLYPGDVFRPDSLARQERSVTAFLEREGFVDPGVIIDTRKRDRDGLY
ncbi:MAG: hypothetical protein GF344_04200, partial [Chitinivibrionales bacterium]|nr:hypothetical protein [Chitinivibrionales bacterium]